MTSRLDRRLEMPFLFRLTTTSKAFPFLNESPKWIQSGHVLCGSDHKHPPSTPNISLSKNLGPPSQAHKSVVICFLRKVVLIGKQYQ